MDKMVQIEIIAMVGVLAGVALYMGQNEIASLGVGGLIGFLSHNMIGQDNSTA